jgi:hypothetical protein
MAGRVPAIHVCNRRKSVDPRIKSGDDEEDGKTGRCHFRPERQRRGRKSTDTLSAIDPLPGLTAAGDDIGAAL